MLGPQRQDRLSGQCFSSIRKRLYHRARNASESRNARCQHLDLKRLPVLPMSEYVETVIVGGGQARVAVRYYLRQQGRAHTVLEQASQPAEAWRNHRWDSFTLVTPIM